MCVVVVTFVCKAGQLLLIRVLYFVFFSLVATAVVSGGGVDGNGDVDDGDYSKNQPLLSSLVLFCITFLQNQRRYRA